ncbi:MAG: thymidine phosphorylase [Candidatus Fermentibacteraceae bacterium]
MKVTDLIAAKRDGREVPRGDLYELAAGVAEGRVADYQAAAFLMAAYIRGLSRAETVALTAAMRDSGSSLEWGDGPPLADKHSTGGVGDKVSIVLAPLAAACGLRVPMVSGRSLGHTGGTLDKLESIPGMRVDLTLREFAAQVNDLGVCMMGQTGEMAPADRELYALRDATSTVTSIPLICASILSKKLAESTDVLVFDVKCGDGAFVSGLDDARKLGRTLVEIAGEFGCRSSALLTSMDYPLGRMVGNALEVDECLALLEGGGPAALRSLTVRLAAGMVELAGAAPGPEEAVDLCTSRLDDGAAMEVFRRMVQAQGGSLESFRSRKPAPVRLEVRAGRSGLLAGPAAREVGEAVRELGGGRYSTDDSIDHRVGWESLVEPGTGVSAGEPVGLVHAACAEDAERASERIGGAMVWDAQPPDDLVLEVL